MGIILKAEHVVKTFREEKILRGISLEVEEETFTAILGPSGSGKSTLLNVLSGLLRPTSGQVGYEGKNICAFSEGELADWKRQEVGHVFQNYLLLNSLTVEENIKIGIDPKGTTLPLSELTHLLDIDSLLHKFPSELSGGQQQRVAIARAVIKKPRILFCDEATGALDEANSKKVVELLHQLKETYGIAVLFVTHNLQIAETAECVITLKDGLIFKDYHNEQPILASQMIWG